LSIARPSKRIAAAEGIGGFEDIASIGSRAYKEIVVYSESSEDPMSDSKIMKEIEGESRLDARVDVIKIAVQKLREELPYSSQFVTVMVRDGSLALQGTLEWNYQRDTAEKIVRAMPSAIGFSNDIALQPVVAASDIKRKIAEALKGSVELEMKRITVDSVGSKVALRGSIRTWAQPTEAERAIP
jgi:osmotically-inducible protein OsmY